jgi:hypothetical protein
MPAPAAQKHAVSRSVRSPFEQTVSGDTFLALPDRGPNAVQFDDAIDNTARYIKRFHTVHMRLEPNASGSSLPFNLSPELRATTLLWSATPRVYGSGDGLGVGSGVPPINNRLHHYFTGRSDNFDPDRNSGNPKDARFPHPNQFFVFGFTDADLGGSKFVRNMWRDLTTRNPLASFEGLIEMNGFTVSQFHKGGGGSSASPYRLQVTNNADMRAIPQMKAVQKGRFWVPEGVQNETELLSVPECGDSEVHGINRSARTADPSIPCATLRSLRMTALCCGL